MRRVELQGGGSVGMRSSVPRRGSGRKPPPCQGPRTAIARMVVAVASASGKGFLGTGQKISPEERACIGQIDRELSLTACPRAAEVLQALK